MQIHRKEDVKNKIQKGGEMVERRVMVRWKIMGRRKDKGGGKSLHRWLITWQNSRLDKLIENLPIITKVLGIKAHIRAML